MAFLISWKFSLAHAPKFKDIYRHALWRPLISWSLKYARGMNGALLLQNDWLFCDAAHAQLIAFYAAFFGRLDGPSTRLLYTFRLKEVGFKFNATTTSEMEDFWIKTPNFPHLKSNLIQVFFLVLREWGAEDRPSIHPWHTSTRDKLGVRLRSGVNDNGCSGIWKKSGVSWLEICFHSSGHRRQPRPHAMPSIGGKCCWRGLTVRTREGLPP